MSQNESPIHPGIIGSRSVLAGVVANLALVIIKGVTGIFGHSSALIADAVESLADVVSSLLVWGGLRLAAKPPDENHPYGHGKAEPLAAMSVSIALCFAAIAIAFHSFHVLGTPHPQPHNATLVVLVVVIVLKELLFQRFIEVGEKIESTAVKSEAWHHRSDAITSLAALIGVSIAVIGGPDYASADEIAALVAAAVIAYNAYCLLRPAISELTDATPPGEIHEQIRVFALEVTGVCGVDKFFIRKMGFDYYADIHVVVNGEISVRDGHDIAHRVKDAIRERDPRVKEVLVHIEPNEEFE